MASGQEGVLPAAIQKSAWISCGNSCQCKRRSVQKLNKYKQFLYLDNSAVMTCPLHIRIGTFKAFWEGRRFMKA
jgi:hypothetical protein